MSAVREGPLLEESAEKQRTLFSLFACVSQRGVYSPQMVATRGGVACGELCRSISPRFVLIFLPALITTALLVLILAGCEAEVGEQARRQLAFRER